MNSHLNSNYADVKTAIGELSAEGRTCIQCGIKKANYEFVEHPNTETDALKVEILLTDGNANMLLDGQRDSSSNHEVSKQAAINETNTGKQNQGIVYYVVGYGRDVDQDTLSGIASDPDSKYLRIRPDANTWEKTYEEIFQDICY